MAAVQSSVDKFIKEFFDKKAELEERQRMENLQPQPFSQYVLVQYFLDKFNNTHDASMPEKERQEWALKIAREIKKIMSMNNGEVKEYFTKIDEEEREEVIRSNDRVIFEFCLIRELSSRKDLVGEAKRKFRREREEAYEAGTFDYSIDAKRSEEILIRMEDVHFPEGSKKLRDVDYSSTYDKLLEKQLANNKSLKK